MKTLLALLTVCVIIIGCTAVNPAYVPPAPGQPDTNTAPHWVPDPRIAGISNTATGIAHATDPVNPWAGVTNYALDAILGVWGSLATWKARQKNSVIATLAQGVVKAGPTVAQAVLDHASNADHFSDVAGAINKATGANQSSTGEPIAPPS